MHCLADLLQIADILLGKMILNGMQHKPVKAINASIVDRLIKRSAAGREKGRPESILRIRDLKHVAHAPYRLDKLRLVIIVYFSAKPL